MAELNRTLRSKLIRKTIIPVFAGITVALLLLTSQTINALWSSQSFLSGEVSLGSWFFTPTPTNFQPVDPGTTLKASLTADGSIERTGDGYSSEAGASPGYGLRGAVCVANRGAELTQHLSIGAAIQSRLNQARYQNLHVFPVEVSDHPELSPGEEYCYPYQVTFESPEGSNAEYRLGAGITITNHSSWTPGSENCPGEEVCPYGPWVTARFNLPLPPTRTPVPTHTPLPTEDDSNEATPAPTLSGTATSTLTITPSEQPATATPPDNDRWTLTPTPTAKPEDSAPPTDHTQTPPPSEALSPTPANTEVETSPTLAPTETPIPPTLEPTSEANPAVDLAIEHLEEKFTASAGAVVVFQLAYANLGSQTASGVVISTSPPANTSFNPVMNSPGWSQADSSEGFVFTLGELAPGGSGTVLFAVLVDDPLSDQVSEITNIAEITNDETSGADIKPSNNISISQVPINDP